MRRSNAEFRARNTTRPPSASPRRSRCTRSPWSATNSYCRVSCTFVSPCEGCVMSSESLAEAVAPSISAPERNCSGNIQENFFGAIAVFLWPDKAAYHLAARTGASERMSATGSPAATSRPAAPCAPSSAKSSAAWIDKFSWRGHLARAARGSGFRKIACVTPSVGGSHRHSRVQGDQRAHSFNPGTP